MRCVGSIDRFLRPGQRASRLGVAVFAARARGLRRARSSPPSPRRASVAARRGLRRARRKFSKRRDSWLRCDL